MADSPCERCSERLDAYVEGLLAPDERDALEVHVAACGNCARLVRDYRILPGLLRRTTDVQMPYDVEVRLRRLVAVALRRQS